MKLTPKEKCFCEQYVIDLNGTQAAIRAGYSAKTAAQIATENLTKPHIKQYVSDLKEILRTRAQVSADMVIEELKSLGFWNIKDFVADNNTIVDISKMDRKRLRPVIGIKTTTRYELQGDTLVPTVTTELKFADKRGALESLGRHLGVFKEDNQQKQMKIVVKRK